MDKLWQAMDPLALSRLYLVLAVVAIILGPFTTMVLWNWFMVPLFNLPQLSWLWALGLGLVASDLFRTVDLEYGAQSLPDKVSYVAQLLRKDLIALALGWVVKFFL